MAKQDIQRNESATPVQTERTAQRPVSSPAVDIIEKQDVIVLTADMPGVEQKDVDVNFEKGVLTLRGHSADKTPAGELLAREYTAGDYERSFSVSEDLDASRIEAVLKNGVLSVTLPKAERAKPRKIAIKTA